MQTNFENSVGASRFTDSHKLAVELERIGADLRDAAAGKRPKLSEKQRAEVVSLLEHSMSHNHRTVSGSDPVARAVGETPEAHHLAALGAARALAEHDGIRGKNPFQNERLAPAYGSEQIFLSSQTNASISEQNLTHSSNELSALEILRSYPSNTKVADLYDQDKEFATALNDLFPGSFEYPDFSWRKIGDIVKSVEKAGTQSIVSATAHVLNDRYADTVIGDNVAAYDALELHGVRDFNDPGHPDGTQCEVDDQNPQFYSVYAHLRDGGVDCVGDFSDPVRAVGYAAELQRKYHYGLHAFSEPIKQLCHEFALSTEDAARIASEKAAFNHVDPSVSQTYAGKVMGISDHHLVLSLGRNAAIFEKAIINGVENLMPGSEVAIAMNDGKAQVVPEKEKEAAISR